MKKINAPAFDEMFDVIQKITDLDLEVSAWKIKKEMLEAEVMLEATLTDKHLVKGKTPSVTFIDRSWKLTGFNGEITETKIKLAEASSKLDEEKRKFEILKMMFDMWRTQSANERTSL